MSVAPEAPRTFQELLPELIVAYSSAPLESHPLANRANELTPAFASLSECILASLPTTDFRTALTPTEVATSVSACAATLAQKQQEVRQFVEAICFQAVEVRVRGTQLTEARIAALQSARRPLLEAVHQVTPPLRPALTAELMCQSLEVVHHEVNGWVQEACHTIAGQLLLAMHVLVELETVGVIEWPGETVCKLHFFRHIVTQDRIGTSVSQQRTESGDDLQRFITVTELRRTTVRNRYSIECHEHHVMNAEAREIAKTQFPIPAQYQQFLDRIPPWIRQHIRILEGDLILERITHRDVREETWESASVQRTVYELEPAILLGHYVITGWGQQEVDRERFRRKQQSSREPPTDVPMTNERPRREAGKAYATWQPTATAAITAAIAVMLLSRLQPGVMVPLAFVLTLVAAGITGFVKYSQSVWRSGRVDGLFVGSATTCIAAGVLAVQSALYGILYGSWPMLGWAIPLALVAAVTKGIAASRQPE
jgi:hypothetical protein